MNTRRRAESLAHADHHACSAHAIRGTEVGILDVMWLYIIMLRGILTGLYWHAYTTPWLQLGLDAAQPMRVVDAQTTWVK